VVVVGIRAGTVGLTLVIAFASGCSDGCPVTRERRAQTLESVASAPDHDPDVTALRFTAVARPDLAGFKSWAVRGTRSVSRTERTAALVPVVPREWAPDDPVPLWVRMDAQSQDAHGPEMQAKLDAFAAAVAAGPVTVAITQHLEADIDMEGTNAFQIGARKAMQAHGLTSPVGAPLCSWPASEGPLRLAD